jgi:hypothetical protein
MPDLVTDGDNLGDHLATRSFKTIKGTDIASATNITIGTSGNTFDVTGTTTIQHFDNANWVVGSVISLHFDGAVTLTHNAGGLSGNQANILLSGDANFTTATGDILTFLLHDSTNWQEISRNVPTSSYTAPTLGSTVLASGATVSTVAGLTLTSPTLTTPALGTPSSGTLTNTTGLPIAGISTTGTASSSTYLRGDGAWSTISSTPTEAFIISASDETTSLQAGTAKTTFRMPYAFTLTAVKVSLTTTSSSGNPTIDINESGTSILSSPVAITAGQKTATATVGDSSLANLAEITVDIDSAGNNATGLKVYLIGTQT